MAFRFKRFEINQDNAPFKIGTDGLLLGAWTNHQQPKDILDIGTGTGLIALMLAQRFTRANIEAIELNKNAVEIASSNFIQSPWDKRISIHSGDFKKFSFVKEFNLIVSNPPFFSGSKLSDNSGKNLARHTVKMSLSELIKKSSTLLSPKGIFALVLPFDLQKNVTHIASKHDLFPVRICAIYPNPQSSPKRILIEFSWFQQIVEESELIVEEFGRHQYSEDYKKLTEEFLLDN